MITRTSYELSLPRPRPEHWSALVFDVQDENPHYCGSLPLVFSGDAVVQLLLLNSPRPVPKPLRRELQLPQGPASLSGGQTGGRRVSKRKISSGPRNLSQEATEILFLKVLSVQHLLKTVPPLSLDRTDIQAGKRQRSLALLSATHQQALLPTAAAQQLKQQLPSRAQRGPAMVQLHSRLPHMQGQSSLTSTVQPLVLEPLKLQHDRHSKLRAPPHAPRLQGGLT